LTASKLQPFLLHEDSMVRDSVAFGFFESWSKDPGLVPLVLEACRRYGEEDTLNLLVFGCRFRLDAQGLIESLRALTTSHPPFVEQWVASAPLDVLSSRAELARSVLSPRAMARLSRRERFRGMKVLDLWRRLEALSGKMDDRTSERRDWDEAEDLIEGLSVLARRDWLFERLAGVRDLPRGHLRWAIVDLVGAMGIDTALDALVGLLEEEDDGLGRATVQALARIGSTSTGSSGSSASHCVALIRDRYRGGSRRFRRSALASLKAIQSEESRALLYTLVDTETDPALRGRIFDAVRFHFDDESETLLKEELARPTSWMIPEEIRKALSVFALLRGEADPEGDRWRRELAARGDTDIYFHIPFLGISGDDAEPP
jgi:hypothetical protein